MTRYWLKYQNNAIPLRDTFILIGRSAECDLVLDDDLVSRRHARVAIVDEGVLLEDLSANGVFLDGQRVPPRCVLDGTAELRIGSHVVMIVPDAQAGATTRRAQPTVSARIDTLEVPSDRLFREDVAPQAHGDDTRQTSFLRVFEQDVDRMIGAGKLASAEDLFSSQIESILATARTEGRLAPDVAASAARCALKLAAVSKQQQFCDVPVEVYAMLPAPMPVEMVDELYRLVHKKRGPKLVLVRDYLQKLEPIAAGLGPADRFALMRLKGLERLIAAR